MERHADSIWNTDRDPLNRLGQRWAGGTINQVDWRTQASALAALTVTEELEIRGFGKVTAEYRRALSSVYRTVSGSWSLDAGLGDEAFRSTGRNHRAVSNGDAARGTDEVDHRAGPLGTPII